MFGMRTEIRQTKIDFVSQVINPMENDLKSILFRTFYELLSLEIGTD